jgi:serine phosphatase RsbU (regulator of sigma subunit)
LDENLERAENKDPRQALRVVDRIFEKYGTTRHLAATMNLFRVSTKQKELQLANAGMPAPLIFRYGQAQPNQIQAAGVYVGGPPEPARLLYMQHHRRITGQNS